MNDRDIFIVLFLKSVLTYTNWEEYVLVVLAQCIPSDSYLLTTETDREWLKILWGAMPSSYAEAIKLARQELRGLR